MNNKIFTNVTLVVFTIFIFIASSYAYDIEAISLELDRLNIEITGKSKSMEIHLPNDLSDPNWGLKKSVCEESRYDLTYCAGKNALLTNFPIKEKWDSREPLDVWVITCEEKIACVYKAVRNNSTLVPGIFPVKIP